MQYVKYGNIQCTKCIPVLWEIDSEYLYHRMYHKKGAFDLNNFLKKNFQCTLSVYHRQRFDRSTTNKKPFMGKIFYNTIIKCTQHNTIYWNALLDTKTT